MPNIEPNIRTGEIDEILGKTPNSLVRWGISIIFIVIMLVITGSWFFRYPDTIVSTIEISTLSPPANVIAKANGKIDSLFVGNNEPVKEKQALAMIENPADYQSMMFASAMADSIKSLLSAPVSGIELWEKVPENLQLGELQAHFSAFMTSAQNLVNYNYLDYYAGRIGAVRKQIGDYRLYYNYMYDQRQTMWTDLGLAEKDYKRHQLLFNNQAIPEIEQEKSQSLYLNKKNAFESVRTSLANINIQISQLENSIIDLQMQDLQQRNNLIISMNEAYNNLKAQLEIWEQRYLLRSPQNGTCVFTRFWSKNQNVVAGETVMTILPDDTLNIIGQLLLPVAGAGKVKQGQRVLIKLHNYPYMEYGMLEGIVQNISAIPHENHYYVEVSFGGGITTSYGKEIPFTQQMQGNAEIITEDIRLLHRIIQPIRHILTKKR